MMIVGMLIWATIGFAVYLVVKSLRGRKQSQATTASGMCPKCRSEIEAGAMKCASCGSWQVPFTQTPLGKSVVVLIVAVIAFGGVALYLKQQHDHYKRQVCQTWGGPNC